MPQGKERIVARVTKVHVHLCFCARPTVAELAGGGEVSKEHVGNTIQYDEALEELSSRLGFALASG